MKLKEYNPVPILKHIVHEEIVSEIEYLNLIW